jgi:hypothetical protein
MSKVVVLSEDTIIDGCAYLKGQVVRVDDGFNTNIRRVVVAPFEQAMRVKARIEAVTIKPIAVEVKPVEDKPIEPDKPIEDIKPVEDKP